MISFSISQIFQIYINNFIPDYADSFPLNPVTEQQLPFIFI